MPNEFILTEERKKRVLLYANYMVQTYATYKATAKAFGVAKWVVYNDINRHLPKFNPKLYEKIKKIGADNYAECVSRMNKVHNIEQDKKLQDFEEYFLSRLKENETFTFKLANLAEDFNLKPNSVGNNLKKLFNKPNCSVILINYGKPKGEYTVAVKIEKYIKMQEQNLAKEEKVTEKKKTTKKKTSKKKVTTKKQTTPKEKKQTVLITKTVTKEEISEEVLDGQIKWEV
jgi:hypothetical protein